MVTLFNGRKFEKLANEITQSIECKINGYSKSKFDNHPLGELTYQLEDTFKIKLPKILEERIYQEEPSHTTIRYAGVSHFNENATIPGIKFTMVIPFHGDASMFSIYPSKYTTMFPYGDVSSHQIKVIYDVPAGQDASVIQSDFNNNLETIKIYLSFLAKDVHTFNLKLNPLIKTFLELRKNSLNSNGDSSNLFGFSIR